MIRMMIADQHPFVSYGLRRAFESAGMVTIVAEAGALAEVWRLLDCTQIDVLICEIAILGGKFCEALEEIIKRRPQLAIVVFTMQVDPFYAVESLRRGAKAYVSKEASIGELACAIRQAVSGRHYIDSRLREQADSIFNGASRRHCALSPRETEVLQLMVDGKRNVEIAKILAVSPKTVSTHRAHILEKMELKTNQQLIRRELQRRLSLA